VEWRSLQCLESLWPKEYRLGAFNFIQKWIVSLGVGAQVQNRSHLYLGLWIAFDHWKSLQVAPISNAGDFAGQVNIIDQITLLAENVKYALHDSVINQE
jgi:hypothetical protein